MVLLSLPPNATILFKKKFSTTFSIKIVEETPVFQGYFYNVLHLNQ
jgi:hypothetical protein